MVNRCLSSWKRPGLAACLGLALLAVQSRYGAAEPPPHFNNKTVTTSFSSTDTNGVPSCMANDAPGGYTDGSGVMSILTENGYNGIPWGDWQFDIYNSTTRTLARSFNMLDAVLPGDPHYTAPANPPFLGSQNVKSRVQVQCTLKNLSMIDMSPGDTIDCPLATKFDYQGKTYRLDAAPEWTGHSETTDAHITCNGADGDGCNNWDIDPIASGTVGRLKTPWTGKGKPQPDINLGDFYMKFHIHITRP